MCTYDLSELVPDIDHVAAMRNILDACCSDPRLAPYCNPACIVLAGHSRGGKLSVLTAGEDKRVRGLLLMDPVDNTAMTPQGPGYPSCLPALRNVISRASPPVPVLVLGAACNGDVIPAEGNYQRFSDAASRGVAWSFDLQGAGHVQFLDKSLGIFAAFSAPGPTSDSVVRQVTKAAMLAWLEAVVRPLALQGGVDTGAANRKLSAVAQALKGMAPASSALRGMELLEASGAVGSGRRDSETGASSSSGSSGASSAAGSGGRPGNFPPITDSYEQLLGRKASELKRMLMERNIPCSDCFEKADLAQRLLERCGSAAVAGRQ